MFNIETLRAKTEAELDKISKDLSVKYPKSSSQDEKVFAILDYQASNTKQITAYLKESSDQKTEVTKDTEPVKAPAKRGRPAKKPVANDEEEPTADSPEVPLEENRVEKDSSQESAVGTPEKPAPVKAKRGRKPKVVAEETNIKGDTAVANIKGDQEETQEDKDQQTPASKKDLPAKTAKQNPNQIKKEDQRENPNRNQNQNQNKNSNPNQNGNQNPNSNQNGNQNINLHRNQNQNSSTGESSASNRNPNQNNNRNEETSQNTGNPENSSSNKNINPNSGETDTVNQNQNRNPKENSNSNEDSGNSGKGNFSQDSHSSENSAQKDRSELNNRANQNNPNYNANLNKATNSNNPQHKNPNQNPKENPNQSSGQNSNQNQSSSQNPNQNPNQHPNQNKSKEVAQQEQKKEYSFDGLVTIEGVLEILPDNYGFLRSSDFSYISSPDDVYVSTNQIRNYGLKTGDNVKGIVRLPKEGEKYFSLQKPTEVNGRDLDFIKDRVAFEHLTPLFPEEKFNLAEKGSTKSTRIVDLFAPIGKGQRAMIVAQPKTGKTMLLKEIANAISSNHPDAYMMVLLIDERPEEVTDMERSVNAEVIASTFDESAEKHVKVANLVLAKAQRMVECGHDVVILLDSITRLARAYNTVTPASGKILSGGVDANALHKPKRFFGAARKIEGGGSLTIIATALIDTGSKMDEVIFEEFKGTGNMELQLDRKIANKRIFPAIDLVASSTRRDDLLHDAVTQQRMWILRKHLADMNPLEAMQFVEKNIKQSINNDEFLMSMNK